MTYRGVYRDGIVVFRGDVDLRNGEAVDVSPARRNGMKSKVKAAAKGRGRSPAGRLAKPGATDSREARARGAKARAAKRPLPGFGAWKHRTDIVDSAEFARALRKRTSTRSSGA